MDTDGKACVSCDELIHSDHDMSETVECPERSTLDSVQSNRLLSIFSGQVGRHPSIYTTLFARPKYTYHILASSPLAARKSMPVKPITALGASTTQQGKLCARKARWPLCESLPRI